MYGHCTNDSCKYSHEEMSEELRKAFEARMMVRILWKCLLYSKNWSLSWGYKNQIKLCILFIAFVLFSGGELDHGAID